MSSSDSDPVQVLFVPFWSHGDITDVFSPLLLFPHSSNVVVTRELVLCDVPLLREQTIERHAVSERGEMRM